MVDSKTLTEVARRLNVTPATANDLFRRGVVQYNAGHWSVNVRPVRCRRVK